jgi:hypothetical protein
MLRKPSVRAAKSQLIAFLNEYSSMNIEDQTFINAAKRAKRDSKSNSREILINSKSELL